MALLIDTQAILWLATNDPKLSGPAREALLSGDEELLVSVITAFEYSDLNRRGRFGFDLPLPPILDRLGAPVVDLPAAAWAVADELPPIHRDPVDRMLIAHAICADMTLVSADRQIRAYPVKSLW